MQTIPPRKISYDFTATLIFVQQSYFNSPTLSGSTTPSTCSKIEPAGMPVVRKVSPRNVEDQ